MIELTEAQGKEVRNATNPVQVIDPASKREFVLVAAEQFAMLRAAFGDLQPSDAYPAIDRAFAPNWDDPKMSDYDDYEKHRP